MSGLNIQNNSWNGWTSSSIGTLFSGFTPSGVNSLSSIVSDYSQIKNGSYGKLVKAYYDKIETPITKKTTASKDVVTKDSKKTNAKMDVKSQAAATDAKQLASVANKFDSKLFAKTNVKDAEGKTEYNYDYSKIYAAVNDFANSYNDVLASTDKLENSSVERAVSSMLNNTRINSSALQKIGINVKGDSTLSVDKEAFMKSDISDIKKLFEGKNSYAAGVAMQADSISAAVIGNSGYTKDGSYNVKAADFFSEYI